MYGTVARLKIKPGKEDDLRRMSEEEASQIPGFVSQLVYRSDADPNELYLAVVFESEQAYRANADSPEQHQRYEQFRALMDADPEWHDGHVILSSP